MTTTAPLRLVAYLRVSTQEQATTGAGLDVQRQQIEQWANANGHIVTEWYADEGVSGKEGLETRPGIFQAMSALTRSRRDEGRSRSSLGTDCSAECPVVDGLIVAKLDRLARSLAIQETLLAQVEKSEAQVFSAVDTENEYLNDDSEPTRRLIRQVLGAVAEWERGMIVARMKAGRAMRAQQGMFAYGSPPYGWRAEQTDTGSRLTPVESEQATLARMRELRDEGRKLQDIADALTDEGHQTKRGGSNWHPGTISRMLGRTEVGSSPEGATVR